MSFNAENRNILFLGVDNALYFPQPSGEYIPSIGACRAYFQLKGIRAGDPESGIKAFNLNFGDETTTSINNSRTTINNEDGSWFTLDGRKVNSPTQRGIYINKGRKVVIK